MKFTAKKTVNVPVYIPTAFGLHRAASDIAASPSGEIAKDAVAISTTVTAAMEEKNTTATGRMVREDSNSICVLLAIVAPSS